MTRELIEAVRTNQWLSSDFLTSILFEIIYLISCQVQSCKSISR